MTSGMGDYLNVMPVYYSRTHWSPTNLELVSESRCPLPLMGGLLRQMRLDRKHLTGCQSIPVISRSLVGLMIAEVVEHVAWDFLHTCSKAITKLAAGAWNSYYLKFLRAKGEWKELLKELLDR